MSLRLQQTEDFWADLNQKVDWYRENAGSHIALRFVDAVETAIRALVKTPGMGRVRFLDWPDLAGIRSFRVARPFHRYLVFYRFNADTLFVERLIHGARDLPR